MEGKYTKSDNTQIPRKLKTLLYIIEGGNSMYTQLSTFRCCLTDHARQTTIFIVLQRKADRPKTGSSGGGSLCRIKSPWKKVF